MKINTLNAYQNGFINSQSDIHLQNKAVAQANKSDELTISKSVSPNEVRFSNNIDTKNLVTKQERQFFVKMFPENKEQIERHVLFNRSGRTQSYATQLGSLVDGRA
jgi:hypothetical protein